MHVKLKRRKLVVSFNSTQRCFTYVLNHTELHMYMLSSYSLNAELQNTIGSINGTLYYVNALHITHGCFTHYIFL